MFWHETSLPSHSNATTQMMTMLPPDPVFVMKGSMSSVMCLTFRITPSLEYIYAGTVTGEVHIWDLQTNREVDKLKCGEESCLSVHIKGANGSTLIVQHKTGTIRFWEKTDSSWSCIDTMENDYCGFCKCVIHEDTLFVPLKDSQMQSVSLTSRNRVTYQPEAEVKLGEIMVLKAFTKNKESYLIAGYESGDLYVWNCGRGIKESGMKLEECPMAIDFDPATMKGVCGSPSEQVVVFVMDGAMRLSVKTCVRLANPGVACVALRPDARVLALGCWDGKLRLYSWKSLVLLAALDCHPETVNHAAFSPRPVTAWSSSCLLAAGSKDGSVSLWNLYN